MLYPLVLLIIAGLFYSFPIWISRLGYLHNYDQTEMGILGIAIYTGTSIIGILPLPVLLRCGSWVPLILSMGLIPFGYVVLIEASTVNMGIWLPALGCVMVSSGAGWVYFYVVSVYITRYPNKKVMWSGICSCCVALGGIVSSMVLLIDTQLHINTYFVGIFTISAILCPIFTLLCLYEDVTFAPLSHEYIIWDVLKSPTYYLILSILMICFGVLTSFFTNLGAYSEYIGVSVEECVIIFNVMQMCGRASVTIIGSRTNAVILLFTITSLTIIIYFITGPTATKAGMYLLSAVNGVYYGIANASTMVLVDLTSPRAIQNMPVAVALTIPTVAIGSLIFNMCIGEMHAMFTRHNWYQYSFVLFLCAAIILDISISKLLYNLAIQR